MHLEKYHKLQGKNKTDETVKKREVKAESKKPLKWVQEGLVVRIICDTYRDGKMYNNKVHVRNVINDTTFLAIPYTPESNSSTQVFNDLTEREIETVLPQTKNFNSQPVMVLRGEFKGETGHILDKEKATQKVTIQLSQDAGL